MSSAKFLSIGRYPNHPVARPLRNPGQAPRPGALLAVARGDISNGFRLRFRPSRPDPSHPGGDISNERNQ